ncbi:hypothetical protein DZD52_18005 [Xanthomonas nasturtii]|uniref:Uncharacterized protein n=1 Tax=Xanthomonas nasturtii TaxID=1843581 RepID=A0A3E1KFD7_9XANT|nr:hypothetical protein DZD52_18005 [Xanthomonas nasturtii]
MTGLTGPWCRRCGQVDARFGWIDMEKRRIVHSNQHTVLDGCGARHRAGVLHPRRSSMQCAGSHLSNTQRASHTSSILRIEQVARGQVD